MQNPPGEEPETALSVTPPKKWAAGVPAVVHALEYSLEQTSPRRTGVDLLAMNQVDGIDCPGCAWADPAPGRRHRNEYCENGAKHINDEATTRRITADFFREHSVRDLAARSDMWLNQQGRLTEPMIKQPGSEHYEPIGWNDALGVLAQELKTLDSPDEAVFYTSGRAGNEAAFVLQLFARAFGTNNLPDCSNMCHESSGFALSETLGTGKGTVSLDDLHHADLIFLVGQNPGSNHPRQLSALEEAKRNGGRIVAVNPLPEAGLRRFKNPQKPSGIVGRGTQIADRFLHIKPGGDLALFQALNRLLLEAEDARPGTVLDHDFIDAHTTGFEEFAQHARTVDWDDVRTATGLTREEIEKVRDEVLTSERVIVCWAMGITQHKHGVPTVREIVNFLMLRGRQPGARRHRRVPGARPQQRPGRPHHGHLGADAGHLPRRPAEGVRLRPAAPARPGHCGLHQGDAGGPRQGLPRPGRQLRPRRSRQRGHRGGDALVPADRPHLHQAQSLAHRLRRHRPDPADAGTNRA